MSTHYYLVHLPEYSELKNDAYSLNNQERTLFNSLEDNFGIEIIHLMGHNMSTFEGLEQLFLLPYDAHPSVQGLDFYLDAIIEALRKRRVVNS